MTHKYKRMKVKGRLIDKHRLEMERHLGRALSRNEVVHHKNGDPSDDRIENLELMSREEHARYHALKGDYGDIGHSRKARGESHGSSKLKEGDVKYIRESKLSNPELAMVFGVDRTLIWRIRSGKQWSHV